MRISRFKYAVAITSSLLVMLASCSEELTYPTAIPAPINSARVKVNLGWSSALGVPDSVTVVAFRMVNQWWTAFRMSTKAPYEGHYTYNSPITSWPDDSTQVDEGSIRVRQGEYRFHAFTTDYDPRFAGASGSIDETGTSLTHENVSFLGTTVVYNPITRAEIIEEGGHDAYPDYNAYTVFVRPTIPQLYTDSIEYVHVNTDTTVSMSPKCIAQRLHLRFPIEKSVKSTRFVVDSVLCEISGIPEKMIINSHQLITDSTYKTAFMCQLTDSLGNTIQDEADSTLLYASSSLDVLGLVSGNASANLRGPGVMQVMIYVHTVKGDGSIDVKRMIQAIVNLEPIITKNKLTRHDIKGAVYQNTNEANLYITTPLSINGQTISMSSKEGSDQIKWTSGKTIHIDI